MTIKIKINDQPLEVPEGINILEAALGNQIPLEHFCYHRYLPVAGNCRTCMVELEGPRGRALTIACNTKVTEGMVIYTNSPGAQTAQKSALEFLLLDHPLDCPICDKAGECKLQDNYMKYGLYDSERMVPRYFKGGKDLSIGEHIILDQERCVLCTRCIRFVDEVTETSELGIIHRGHESTLTTFPGKALDNAYSGNTTDICPVGALTLKEFRFKQRVWFLKKTESICTKCARGCNLWIEQNRETVFRLMPRENPEINRTWICNEGRMSFNEINDHRIVKSQLYGQVDDLGSMVEKIQNILEGVEKEKILGIASPWATLEDNFILRKLFKNRWNLDHLVSLLPPLGESDSILRLPQKYPNGVGLQVLEIPELSKSIIEKLNDRHFEVLLVMENEFWQFASLELQQSLFTIKHIIVLTTHQSDVFQKIEAVFPVRAFAEKYGTLINAMGYLQKINPAINSYPEIVESSIFIARLAQKMKIPGFEFETPVEVFNALSQEQSIFPKIRFHQIPSHGLFIPLDTNGVAPAPFSGHQKVDNVFVRGHQFK
jgi:NADH-quinone oxidoreductase subunit G